MKTTIAQRWAALEAASAYARLSKSTLYRLLDRGHVASSRVGTRRLVDLRSLDAHLERCRVECAIGAIPATTGPPAPPAEC